MDTTNNTLINFRNAGEAARMDMHMNHRELRSLFDQIETEEETLRASKIIRCEKKIVSFNLQRLLRGCCAMHTKA